MLSAGGADAYVGASLRSMLPWLLALIVFGAHWVVDAALSGAPLGAYLFPSMPFWAWGAVPVAILFWRLPPAAGGLWGGAALAAAGSGILALCIWLMSGGGRVSPGINAIPFGNLSLYFGVLSALGALFWRASRTRGALWFAAAVMGLVASLLSGTRGGWITLPLVMACVLAWRGRWLRGRWRALPLALRGLAWLLLAGGVAAAWTLMEPRMADFLADLHGFVADGDTGTSVGLRLDMWGAAWSLFLQKPWLGWGEQGLVLELRRWILEGRLNAQAQYFGYQLHGDVLDTLARRGLLGLATLLPLYMVPAWKFAQGLRAPAGERAMAMAGLLTVVMFAGFGLTQSQFRDPYSFSVYLVLISAIWATLSDRTLGGSIHQV